MINDTECSFYIVFFKDFKIYSGLWPVSVLPQRVHQTSRLDRQMAGRTSALLQNWRIKKNDNILRKNHNIEHPVSFLI